MRKDNDDRIILALLSAPTVREAAAAAGVSERTVYARLKEPAFNQRLAEARREMWRGHAVALQAKLGGAIETIAEIMESENAPSQVRLNAAESIVRNAMKISEQADFAERLEAIEKARGIT